RGARNGAPRPFSVRPRARAVNRFGFRVTCRRRGGKVSPDGSGRPRTGGVTMSEHESAGGAPTRRDFLHRAAGAGAGAAAGGAAGAAAAGEAPLLPTVKLGPHAVTRLILGGNPIYGYSHFNRLLSRHMTDWHTPERVVELLKRCEQAGVNAWQNSYAERTLQ